jgi:hypothetical protein
MKKKMVKRLIEEYLLLRKKKEILHKEFKRIDRRYEKVLRLLYIFRSKEFHHSVLQCLNELSERYSGNQHLDDLIHSVVLSLKDENIERRKYYTSKEDLHLFEEKVEEDET